MSDHRKHHQLALAKALRTRPAAPGPAMEFSHAPEKLPEGDPRSLLEQFVYTDKIPAITPAQIQSAKDAVMGGLDQGVSAVREAVAPEDGNGLLAELKGMLFPGSMAAKR